VSTAVVSTALATGLFTQRPDLRSHGEESIGAVGTAEDEDLK
jgi:hypothetical protein